MEHDMEEVLENVDDVFKEELMRFGLPFASVVPGLVAVLMFSRMGMGMTLYNLVSPQHLNLSGDASVVAAALSVTILYIFDWPVFKRWAKVLTALVPLGLLAAGCMLKGRKYPWGPMLMLLFISPMLIGALRFVCNHYTSEEFYLPAARYVFFSALMVVMGWTGWMYLNEEAWGDNTKAKLILASDELYANVLMSRSLNYSVHCAKRPLPGLPGVANLTNFDLEDRDDITSACSNASTVWFSVFACPFFVAAFQTVFALFLALQGSLGEGNTPGAAARTERVLKRFAIFLAVCIGGLYGSVSISGADLRMGSMVAAFFSAALVAMTIFTFLETPDAWNVGARRVKESKLLSQLLGLWRSDWARAVLVGGPGLLIPYYLFANRLKTCYLRAFYPNSNGAKEARAHNSSFHGLARKVFGQMKTWNWVSIILKINLLCEAFFILQVGVAKATYVFLSWLNKQFFFGWNFWNIVVMIVIIGFTMFMLPPVPGIPVYVFCGVVIADQADNEENRETLGYIMGIIIAVVVAFALKILASCGQYCLGYQLGNSLKIQQLIGVDKVPTRALEMILRKPGLSPPKVAVLVGGPDWPTSITCGILKLNLLQMVIGTCPVILPMVPSVLAGAFLSKTSTVEDTIWNSLASGATSGAVVCQLIPQAFMVYFLAQTIDKHGEELAKPREEHRKIEDLTRSELAFNGVYQEVTRWADLPWSYRCLLLAATIPNMMAAFVFGMAGELCFRQFSVSSDITDPIPEGGLGGDPKEIVFPIGRIALAMFAFAVCTHYVFLKVIDARARTEYERRQAAGSLDDKSGADMDAVTPGDRGEEPDVQDFAVGIVVPRHLLDMTNPSAKSGDLDRHRPSD